MAPAGTPRAIVERLREALAKASGVAELRTRFGERGIERVASATPEEFGTFLRRHIEEFEVLARQTGMKSN